MTELPYDYEAYQLLHEGSIALAEVESNGMCVDVDYIHFAIKKGDRKLARLQAELEEDEVVKVWKRSFPTNFKWNALNQLSTVLFDVMGYTPPEKTENEETDNYKMDEENLSKLEIPFVQKFVRMRKLQKGVNTNLRGILREVVNGRIHCFFNLHLVRTYRSSSQDFNFQNLPVRDEEIAKLIRSAFIPSPGNQIVEVDYSGAEVKVATCYHKDPTMIEYITDPTKDMHRDMASECYQLPIEEVSKLIRYCGKNMFVFPEFYGDWYLDCARSLWAACEKLNLKTVSGKPLRQHLNEIGMTELGDLDQDGMTFVNHLRQVEEGFWGDRFPVYARWKKNWYADYLDKGWFQTLTGFICQGVLGRNDVINYPVQGSAFHLLLWSLIEIQKRMHRRGFKSKIVGQIHDSIVFDMVPEERDEVLALCKRVMTEKVKKRFPWLIVPMEIEAEVAPVGKSWADKKGYEIAA